MSQKKDQTKRIKYCVLICESLYSDYDNVSPFTQLGNYSAIDYTINWLIQNDIQEIFMFYSSLKQQIQQYYHQIIKIVDAKLHLHYMKPTQLKSFGDVIREVHFRDLVSEDFLVLYADSISNISLNQMTQNHFDKKMELKNVVLTTAMRKGVSSQMYVLNSSTNQILQVDNELRKQFSLNTEKISLKKLSVSIRRDLVPADVFICTIEVVKAFKETYEYATMQDFIVGMLTSEVYEQKINLYELTHTQVSYRLNKAASFYSAYMNYICGYLNPYTIYSQQRMIKFQKNNSELSFTVGKFNKIFRKSLKVSDSAILSNNVYIGQYTKIHDNCNIFKSIIGKNCIINKNVQLKNCIILDGCTLSENSNFQYSLIQKVHQTIKIHNFKHEIHEQYQRFIERELFLQTPQPQKSTFDQQLVHLLGDKPEEETILVSQLVRIRQQYTQSQSQLTKQIIKILKPQGVKGIQQLTQQWGPILIKIHHEEQDNLINSLLHSCLNIENYLKAFHLFLQYFYHYEILSKEAIISWYKSNKGDTVTLNLCKAFITNLEEQDEDDNDEDSQEN